MKQELDQGQKAALASSVQMIRRRGPDHEATKLFPKAGFAHTRLSIIDTSSASNQPMTDESGRYTLVFNGEIYNYKELAKQLQTEAHINFRTSGDTEVLLQGLIREGIGFLNKINGFFAFGFYDSKIHELLLARDRYGIKPLYFAEVGSGWVFGSNLSSCVALGARGEIDHQSLTTYLQLSYIPAPASILKGVQKCLPGNAILINVAGLSEKVYYALPDNWVDGQTDATEPAKQVKTILENSVKRRLIADVPVGTFLSGGLDSSVISLLAAREHPGISAFSIGFPDQPFYDESAYARITAKQIGVNHHVLEVREKDLEEELYHILDTFDEPFADSSAILVNMLSKFTRKEVTVALSGDGADELFGGYNKHRALYRSTGKGLVNAAMKKSNRILELLPASRSHKTFDKLRKAQRYSRGLKLDFPERYWAWACFSSQKAVYQLLRHDKQNFTRTSHIEDLLQGLNEGDFNSVLKADFQLVLANDMLYKVDSMSMQHGLEVRVPFLDHHLVDYVFKLHSNHKIDKTVGKKLLRSAFDKDFPSGAFDRNKRGFEAPLKQWFAKALRPMLDQYCNASFLEEQGLFNPTAVAALRQKVSSNNPGDAPHTLWAILVFQHWWNRHRVGRLQS